MINPIYRLLANTCFFILLLIPAGTLYAQSVTLPLSPIANLDYTAVHDHTDLSVADDGQGNTWVRGHVPEHLLGIPIVFQIPLTRIHDYRIYIQRGDRLVPVPRNLDNRGNPVKSRYPRYAFTPDQPLYYIHMTGNLPQTFLVQLEEDRQFSSKEAIDLFGIGLYYGLALMSVVFNLVFYLVFRDKRFITYCILLFTTFISFFYEDGIFYYLSDGRWAMDYLIVWNSSVTAIISLLFTYYFLDLHGALNRHRKWYYRSSGVLLLLALVYTLTDIEGVYHLVSALCFVFALTCLYLAIRRFRQDVYARFLVLSFSLVVLTGIGYVLYAQVNASVFAWFGIGTFRLVSAAEIIAISFAIIYKVKSLQEENDRCRTELDTYLQELEVLSMSKGSYLGAASQGAIQPLSERKAIAEALKEQHDLTNREMEVLLCIWEGLSNKEIAEKLFVSVSTTKYHVGNLYLKLDVKNRNQVQVLRRASVVATSR